MQEVDRLYTVAEALPLLGVRVTKFYGLLDVGKLQAIKVGTKTLVAESEIARFRASLPVIGRKNAA